VIAGTAGIAAAALAASATAARADTTDTTLGGIHAIPELAPQWKKLDLAKILSRPPAYVSISQVNSLYEPWGRGKGPRITASAAACRPRSRSSRRRRRAANFKTFHWIGYEVFRENYPQSVFDKVQYESWTGSLDWPAEKKKADNELVAELKALVRPGDYQYNEIALQSSFLGTPLPLDLSRKRIEAIVFHRHPSRLVASRATPARRATTAICRL